MKYRAPWYREIWFGCDEIPFASKVMRTSIVAVGASVVFDLGDLARSRANAEDKRLEILSFGHVVVMLSGNSLGAQVSKS